jgi:protein arginine N-methyltransferase 1
MYSVTDYGQMMADKVRMDAYAAALRRSVRPGSIVVDIGTGPGIMALLACRYGAARVYAIEVDEIIQVAREVAAANGVADRIEFIHSPSTEVSLPRRADVIVSDLRDVLSFGQKNLLVAADARKRFLAEGGVLIPQRDLLWAAPVEASEIHAQNFPPPATDGLGFNFDAWRKARIEPAHLLAEPQSWGTIDYTAVASPNFCGEASWTLPRAGAAHGFGVWFDTVLLDEIGFSNAPGAPRAIYGQGYFPFLEPVALAAGDTLQLSIRVDLVGNEYMWKWTTRLSGAQIGEREWTQSTFYGSPVTPAALRKLSASHVPELSDDGRIDLFILGLLQSGLPVGEAAGRLRAQFPEEFPSEGTALTRVGELSLKYSR